MLIASLKSDPFDFKAVQSFYKYCEEHKIIPCNDVEAEEISKKLQVPYLVFPNPHIRISDPESIISFHLENGFSEIFDKNRIISKMPSSEGSAFFLSAAVVYHEKPACKPAPILMVAHNRTEYFKLSLNSLIHSLFFSSDTPIHIMLSKPNDSIRDVAFAAQSYYPNLYLYESVNNIGLGGFNILLQYLKPEKFIMYEEDFILPQSVKFTMPYWPHIFTDRLDYLDLVAFSTSLENLPENFYSDLKEQAAKKIFQYGWNISGHAIGSTMATTLKNYLKASSKNGPYHVTPDGNLLKLPLVSINSITGYHIGWNQEMDYGIIQNDWGRFPNPEDAQVFRDYQLDRLVTCHLSKIYECSGGI